MKNILFVCKYNRFRSRVASTYFNKINKNKGIKAEGAGVIEGAPLNKTQVGVAKKFGINIKGKPRGTSSELLKKQDLVIIVAEDVPKSIFDKKCNKIIVWKIRDAKNENDRESITKIIKKIMKRVEQLNKKLSRNSRRKK